VKRNASGEGPVCYLCCQPLTFAVVAGVRVSTHKCEQPKQELGPVYPDGLPGHNQTDTSTEASESVVTRLREKQLEVLLAIRGAGPAGMTAHEVSERLQTMPVQSVNSRTNELAKLGRIEDSGERRRGPYGKRVIVWVACG
jgi:hypothetical protein